MFAEGFEEWKRRLLAGLRKEPVGRGHLDSIDRRSSALRSCSPSGYEFAPSREVSLSQAISSTSSYRE